MTEESEKTKKPGLCRNCPVGLGFPVCWVCVFAAIIAIHLVGNFLLPQ